MLGTTKPTVSCPFYDLAGREGSAPISAKTVNQ